MSAERDQRSALLRVSHTFPAFMETCASALADPHIDEPGELHISSSAGNVQLSRP